MSVEFFLRILFMVILGIAGGFWGHDLAKLNPPEVVRYTIGIALVGALAGLILTPYFTTRPARALRRLLGRIAAETLFAGLTAWWSACSPRRCSRFLFPCFPSRLGTRCRSSA